MSAILDITRTPEYKEYSKRHRIAIGHNMVANAECIEDKSGAIYSLDGVSYEECLTLIKDSLAQKANLLLERVKDNIVEPDPAMVY